MAKKQETEEVVMLDGAARFDIIDGFVLENAEKLERVLYGEPQRSGQPGGGLVEKYGSEEKVPPSEVLAHYDKIGGFMTKGVGGDERVKVKNGAFWDQRKRKMREVPEIKYLFNVAGNFIEVDDPAHLAQAVTKVEKAVSEQQKRNEEKKMRARTKRLTR